MSDDANIDARALLREGDAARKAGNTPLAIALYEKAAHYYAATGFSLKATAVWKEICSLAPDRLDARLYLAECYAKVAMVSEACAEFRVVIARASGPEMQDLKNRASKGLGALLPS